MRDGVFAHAEAGDGVVRLRVRVRVHARKNVRGRKSASGHGHWHGRRSWRHARARRGACIGVGKGEGVIFDAKCVAEGVEIRVGERGGAREVCHGGGCNVQSS
jgi:hypothetical protein